MLSRPRSIALLLILLTLVIYLPVLRYDFINFDDQVYVTENSPVQAGWTWAGVQWAFTTWHGGNWHPLTWLSHMTDCELFGVNPSAHHAVNALFHALNAAALFFLLQRLFKSMWANAFIAAVFAWHPLHVESVAWISERKDVLSTLFALLSLHAYVRYAREKYRPAFWWALVFLALGLLSKPMLVTIPFVFLLVDWWPLERLSPDNADRKTPAALITEKWPFFILIAASCVVTYLAQRSSEAVMTLGQLSASLRFEESVMAYGLYLVKTVWPVGLVILYPLPNHLHFIHAAAAASGAVLLLLSWLAWRLRRTAPYLLFGWAWFLGMLLPVIGLVKVGSALIADRYTYLPMVGLAIAVAMAGHSLTVWRPSLRKPVIALAGVWLVACIILTERQLPYWSNSETLFKHALDLTTDNATAFVNYSAALEKRGDFTNALIYCQRAEAITPEDPNTHNNLGFYYLDLNRPADAVAEFQQAIHYGPQKPLYHNSLGLGLVAAKRFADALPEFARASALDPTYVWPHYESGDALLKLGRDSEAIDQFRQAVQIDPNNYQILTHIAQVLAATDNPAIRDGKTALLFAQKANELTGGVQPLILDVLGMAYAATGNFDEAVKSARQALETAQAAKLPEVDALARRLALYQAHQPWTESFRATNAPATTP
jgi:tetratricopeptide (TPR) repeat protein